MAVDFSLITFEESGFPVELHDESACARAVAAGRIHSATEIIVYHTDRRNVRQKAGEFPLFATLLAPPAPEPPGTAELEPVARPPEPPEPVATRPEPAPIAEESTSAESAAATDVTADPPAGAESLPETSAPPAQNPLKWIVLAGLALWFFSFVATRHPTETASNVGDATTTEANAASSAADPEAGLERQTLYTVREVNLQQSAKSGAGVGKLPRNTTLIGVIVSGDTSAERWLKIKEGPQTGLYVWGGNLSAESRPELDTSFSGDQQVTVDTPIRVEPNENATVIVGERTSVTAGDIVSVAGSFAGSWAEIAMRKGGVGYVPMASFATTDTADVRADSPTAANSAVDPAVQPSDRVSGHSIYVRNQCPYSLSIALYYRSSSGWEISNGRIWNFAANTALYPAVRNSRLIAVSPQIYYRILEANGEQISNFGGDINVNYGNQSLSMKKAEVLEASDGDYEISFTC